MNTRQIIRGLVTYLPGIDKALSKIRGTGGTLSARYCYSVWLRHLVKLHENSGKCRFNTIAELGPGDSLGIGLAGLLSGANNYYAFDIINFASNDRNLEILEQLIDLFKNRTPIPDEEEFPEIEPYLESYAFPVDILPNSKLEKLLDAERLNSIRRALKSLNKSAGSGITITYMAPWHHSRLVEKNSVDLIISQAVMEHVEDIEFTYKKMGEWLAKDGLISHQIDFKCHGYTNKWNGHWGLSDFGWKLIMGRKSYILNREPHSYHLETMKKCGFEILCNQKVTDETGIQKDQLSDRFRYLSDEDLITKGAYIQASLDSFAKG